MQCKNVFAIALVSFAVWLVVFLASGKLVCADCTGTIVFLAATITSFIVNCHQKGKSGNERE